MTKKPTLAEALADHRIRPNHWKAGVEQRLVCSECGGGSTREDSLALRLDADGGAVWTCHRGKCGWSGNIPAGTVEGSLSRGGSAPPREPPKPAEVHRSPERTEALYDFFAKRGIGRATVDEFGIYLNRDTWFPQLEKEPFKTTTAVVFPYREGGEVVNHKYRGYRLVEVPDGDGVLRKVRQKIHRQDGGAKKTLYNGDCLDGLGDGDICVFVEGEFDVAALWEAGIRTGLSVPDGSPAKLLEEADPKRLDDKRYAPLMDRLDDVRKVGRIVIAGDDDEPGRNHAEEIARRIGKDLVYRVTSWPGGCNDANEVLQRLGAEALREAIDSAEPWISNGVHAGVSAAVLSAHRAEKRPRPLTTGLPSLDTLLRFPQHGGLVVMTGAPGMGKTTLFNALTVHAAKLHKWTTAICSPEMGMVDTAGYMSSVYSGASFFGGGEMAPHQIEDCARFLSRHVIFLDKPEEKMSLDWILGACRGVIRRRQINMLVLDGMKDLDFVASTDPDPRKARAIEARRSGMLHTHLVADRLGEFRRFAREHGVLVVMIAHPHQLKRDREGKYPIPTGYDLSGGAAWYDNAEAGYTIVREGEGYAKIICWKARHALWSAYGETTLRFVRETGRFFEVGAPVAEVVPPAPSEAPPAEDLSDIPWNAA